MIHCFARSRSKCGKILQDNHSFLKKNCEITLYLARFCQTCVLMFNTDHKIGHKWPICASGITHAILKHSFRGIPEFAKYCHLLVNCLFSVSSVFPNIVYKFFKFINSRFVNFRSNFFQQLLDLAKVKAIKDSCFC